MPVNRYHLEAFPFASLSQSIYEELSDTILYYIAEQTMSDVSQSPYDMEELAKLHSVVTTWKYRVEANNVQAVCIFAKAMGSFCKPCYCFCPLYASLT